MLWLLAILFALHPNCVQQPETCSRHGSRLQFPAAQRPVLCSSSYAPSVAMLPHSGCIGGSTNTLLHVLQVLRAVVAELAKSEEVQQQWEAVGIRGVEVVEVAQLPLPPAQEPPVGASLEPAELHSSWQVRTSRGRCCFGVLSHYVLYGSAQRSAACNKCAISALP